MLRCTPALPALSPEAAAAIGPTDAPPGEHLLLYPTGAPEELLGREVQLSADGGWSIADERAPGCEVQVRRTKSQYERAYRTDLKRMAVASLGYAGILGMKARYGASIQAQVIVKNVEVVTADLRGPCGTYVVDSVRVGTGERSLVRTADAGAEAGVRVASVPLGTEAGTGSTVAGRFAWSEPQGYAFTYRRLDPVEPIRIEAVLPERLTEGEELELAIHSTRDARLVVFFLEDNGEGGVLFPSKDQPETHVAAGETIRFPKLRAALRVPGREARETLVVYALCEQGDFETLKPPPGGWTREGAAYAAELTQKLSSIPMRRWARTAASYRIVPAKGAQPSSAGSIKGGQ